MDPSGAGGRGGDLSAAQHLHAGGRDSLRLRAAGASSHHLWPAGRGGTAPFHGLLLLQQGLQSGRTGYGHSRAGRRRPAVQVQRGDVHCPDTAGQHLRHGSPHSRLQRRRGVAGSGHRLRLRQQGVSGAVPAGAHSSDPHDPLRGHLSGLAGLLPAALPGHGPGALHDQRGQGGVLRRL